MNPENDEQEQNETEFYGDQYIASQNAPVPAWLQYSYVFWLVVGLAAGIIYWNGSWGWLDRGYWQQLQRAANTTYPFHVNKAAAQAEEAASGNER